MKLSEYTLALSQSGGVAVTLDLISKLPFGITANPIWYHCQSQMYVWCESDQLKCVILKTFIQ